MARQAKLSLSVQIVKMELFVLFDLFPRIKKNAERSSSTTTSAPGPARSFCTPVVSASCIANATSTLSTCWARSLCWNGRRPAWMRVW